MKDYSTYTTIDFVLDKEFQEWIWNSDEDNTTYWQEVLLLYPYQQAAIDKAAEVLQSLKFKPISATEIPEERLLEGILDKIYQEREKVLEQARSQAHVTKQARIVRSRSWQKVAASLTLLLSFSFALYFIFSNPASRQIQTAYGETREVVLPDGSLVTLNANSYLEFSTDWDDVSEREVLLEGEAYFKVSKVAIENTSAHNAPHEASKYQKFIVHTKDLDVVVLGTSFNVNHRREKTQVVLTEGKVEVQIDQEKKKVMMEPGELLEYQPAQRSIAKEIVNPELYSSWQTHQLMFNGVPLSQVAQRLEEIFGYKVLFDDEEISQYIFRGTVPSDDIEVSVAVLENAFGITVEKNEKQLIFSK